MRKHAPFNDHTWAKLVAPFCAIIFFLILSPLFQLTIQLHGKKCRPEENGNFSATVCRSYSIIHLADEWATNLLPSHTKAAVAGRQHLLCCSRGYCCCCRCCFCCCSRLATPTQWKWAMGGRGQVISWRMTLALMSKNVKITWQADGNKRRQYMANDEIYFAKGAAFEQNLHININENPQCDRWLARINQMFHLADIRAHNARWEEPSRRKWQRTTCQD